MANFLLENKVDGPKSLAGYSPDEVCPDNSVEKKEACPSKCGSLFKKSIENEIVCYYSTIPGTE